MTEFTRKNINIETLGEQLKNVREKSGVAIEEVAKVTKISKLYLGYIESGSYDKLPSDVYVKGFLRSYSSFLGLNAESVLRLYKKEKTIQCNVGQHKKKRMKRKKIKIPAIVLPFRVLVGLLGGVFFIVIAWYFYSETGKFAEAPLLLISSPLDGSIVDNSSVEIIGVTDIGSQVKINGQNIFVSEKGEFREKISLTEGINKLRITSINKFDKEIQREINISARYKKETAIKIEINSSDNGGGDGDNSNKDDDNSSNNNRDSNSKKDNDNSNIMINGSSQLGD